MIYKYQIDPNCDCTVLVQDLKLKDTAEIDPNILPNINTFNEILPLDNRKDLPFFEANDTIGQAFYPSDLPGKVTYIDLWASWCVPCRAEMPYLKTIRDQYAGTEVQIISISLDKADDLLKWLAATEQLQMDWTNWIIPDGLQSELSKELDIKGIPRYILLDKRGRIANKNAPRPSDKEAIEKLINKLLTEN